MIQKRFELTLAGGVGGGWGEETNMKGKVFVVCFDRGSTLAVNYLQGFEFEFGSHTMRA